MAKKGSIFRNMDSRKGPFKPSEIAHSKRMSTKKFPTCGQKRSGNVEAGNATAYIKASGEHGQHGKSTDNNMSHNTGGYRIGKGTRTFKSNHYFQAGPRSFGQHGQPAGHKSLSTNFIGKHIRQFHREGK